MNKIEQFLDEMCRVYIKSFVRCYTCDRYLYLEERTVGHCFSRRHLNTRWNLNNIRLQCPICNYNPKKSKEFKSVLKAELGELEFNRLEKLAKSNCTDKRQVYIEALKGLINAFVFLKDNQNAEKCRRKLEELQNENI